MKHSLKIALLVITLICTVLTLTSCSIDVSVQSDNENKAEETAGTDAAAKDSAAANTDVNTIVVENFEAKLQEYAELAVKKGVNIQKGQKLLIFCPVSQYEFARMCTKAAYDAGASDVIMEWTDGPINKLMFQYASDAALEYKQYDADRKNSVPAENMAYLAIRSEDPELLSDVDPVRVTKYQTSKSSAIDVFHKAQMNKSFAWNLISVPNTKWAEKVFPELKGQNAVNALWNAIFESVYVTGDGTSVDKWNDHNSALRSGAEKLTNLQFKSLHYTNSLGTDFTVELPEDHIWVISEAVLPDGRKFIANIPTEECYTSPQKYSGNGVLYASKPLVLNGTVINDMRLEMKDGKIVKADASSGLDVLEQTLDTDENARYLGEISLVPYDSPISKQNILYYDTLYDENASCHLAFGSSYPRTVKNGTEMSEEELAAAGLNDSLVHEDFMIGTKDMKIAGTTHDGEEIVIFENGNYTPRFTTGAVNTSVNTAAQNGNENKTEAVSANTVSVENFEAKLREYAELVIKKGVNLQKGQKLMISCQVPNYEFARMCTEAAYEAGASDVIMDWTDEVSEKMMYQYADESALEYKQYDADKKNSLAKEGAAFLNISSEDPNLLSDVDSSRVSKYTTSKKQAISYYNNARHNNSVSWCKIGFPNTKWAETVFPELEGQNAVNALWNAIFESVYVTGDGTSVEKWNDHISDLQTDAEKLNILHFKTLHFTSSSGTDFTVDLPEHHIWTSAGSLLPDGTQCIVNIPTEECFTSPLKYSGNGVIYASKPLVLNGTVINDMRFEIKDGKIVKADASSGLDVLENALDTDEGSRYLGEISLVPYDSPISKQNILYYKTLFDENAACHIAFGSAYPETIEGGTAMSEEELAAAGLNDSLVHEDFMIGTKDMKIVGTTHDGEEIVIFENGNYTPRFTTGAVNTSVNTAVQSDNENKAEETAGIDATAKDSVAANTDANTIVVENFEAKLREYAELVIKTGVNLQKGQKLMISCPVYQYEFARLCTKAAYDAGASDVIMEWKDDITLKMMYQYADDNALEYKQYNADRKNSLAKEGAAFLFIDSSDPNVYNDVDPSRVFKYMTSGSKANREYTNARDSNTVSWCVIGVPNTKWAETVFPELDGQNAVNALWNAVFESIYVTGDGTSVEKWNDHISTLQTGAEKLNELQFKSLHYTSSLGTDFTVDLPETHLWVTAESFFSDGTGYVVNMPTEECFTSPLKCSGNGVLYASKPLVLNGTVVNDIRFEIKDGKIVKADASSGLDVLEQTLDTDEGSRYLGEISLVPYDSPISNQNILYYDTLYDENASCHIAFGNAFPRTVKNGTTMSEEELAAAGLNDSLEHTDFMIGTKDMKIVGTTHDGEEIVIFENGNYTPRFTTGAVNTSVNDTVSVENFEAKLREYAELVIKTGVNLQKGQKLMISCPVYQYEFARLCTKAAYDAGASEVIMDWNDDITNKLMFQNADDAALECKQYYADKKNSVAKENMAVLSINSDDPTLLSDVDPARVTKYYTSKHNACSDYYSPTNLFPWCMVSVPNTKWAETVFPELKGQNAVNALWNAVFESVYVTGDGTSVEKWNDHISTLQTGAEKLNELQFKSLHFTSSSGTDFTVDLPEHHIWTSVRSLLPDGTQFIVNIPSEECFTSPLKYSGNGVIYASKPLALNGTIVSDIRFEVKEGKIIKADATSGLDALESVLDTDENSRYLGEISLVPYDSPISNQNILYYDTLYDENASCHIAFGFAYPDTIEGGEEMSEEELAAAGLNDSLEHTDFMIGTKDMKIVGTTHDGEEIVIFENGNYTPRFTNN